MKETIILVIVWIGTIVSAVYLLPQYIKLVRTKSAADLSLFSNIVAVIGGSSWILYLTLKAVYYDLSWYDRSLLIVSSISDWGITFFSILILIYQLLWLKKNNQVHKLKCSAKKMPEAKLKQKIAVLREELGKEMQENEC